MTLTERQQHAKGELVRAIQDLFRILSLLVGAVPVIFYPGIRVALVMAVAAGAGSHPGFLGLLDRYVLFGAKVYPVVYIAMALVSWWAKQRKSTGKALFCALVPLFFIASLAIAGWVVSSSIKPQ